MSVCTGIRKATGKYLDRHGEIYNLKRKRYFWFFKESDKRFRKRIIETITRR